MSGRTNSCSRYSTGAYVEKQGIREDALCNKGFNNVNVDKQFNLNRPAFRSGTLARGTANVSLPKNRRNGTGNRNLQRNNFISPSIKGREEIDFEKLQAQDISEGGVVVQLGDKTLEKLFKVQIEDDSDIEWIDEYNRRLAAGESAEQLRQMPPLGRAQRQVSQMKNIGQSSNNKIEMLSAMVLQGNTENKRDLATLIAATAEVLGNIENLEKISIQQYNQIRVIIGRLNIPKNYRVYGFTHRIFNWDQYREQQGFINLYLLSNVFAERSLGQPLIS
jgi:hypothetical protein